MLKCDVPCRFRRDEIDIHTAGPASDIPVCDQEEWIHGEGNADCGTIAQRGRGPAHSTTLEG